MKTNYLTCNPYRRMKKWSILGSELMDLSSCSDENIEFTGDELPFSSYISIDDKQTVRKKRQQ